MKQIRFQAPVTSFEGNSKVEFFGLPEACAQCKRGQDFSAPLYVRAGRNSLEYVALFQCRFLNCRELFLSSYLDGMDGSYQFTANFTTKYISLPEEIPALIDEISPEYRKIYTQAWKAEKDGLDLIAGCGYRKALEFLIKDYAISCVDVSESYSSEVKEKKVSDIKKSQLGMVINKHLNISKVKQMALRAAWLGNDETHYERKHTNLDVAAMKTLMKLTIHHIESEELTKKFEEEMKAQ